MSIASEPKHCAQCGGTIPPEAPQGLCPKCLLMQASMPTEAGQGAATRPVPPTHEELAAAFPQLEILELIGQGGMGFVFKARQPKIDRFVALKILPQSLAADPAFAGRFTREGRVLAKLNHPNIVTLHDFGVVTGILPAVEPGFQPGGKNVETVPGEEKLNAADTSTANPGGKMPPSTSDKMPDATALASHSALRVPHFYYLLMEFVDGVNLRQAMKAGRFTPDQALAIVPKICEALQFAHNEGILHRDIKPENILVDRKGRVKVADFGIAKLVGDGALSSFGVPPSGGPDRLKPELPTPNLTEAGKALGTPNYMAPEQQECSGEVDQRADIYSLGVVFYEMLTGELPLGHFAPPSEKSTADPRVDEVVLRALEKEKAKRYASADEVKTQVETIAETPDSGRRRGDESQTEKQSADKDKSQSLLTSSPTSIAPRFSRTAIVGAGWIPVSFVALAVLYWLRHAPHGPGTPMWVQYLVLSALLLLGVSGGFGTTILGWVAVTQIRRSAEKLYGLWLAVFDGMLFPLLALDGVIVILGGALAEGFEGLRIDLNKPLLGLSIVAALVVDWLSIRRVWRAVNATVAQSKPDVPSTQPDLWKRMKFGALIGLVIAGGVVGERLISDYLVRRAGAAIPQEAARQAITPHLQAASLRWEKMSFEPNTVSPSDVIVCFSKLEEMRGVNATNVWKPVDGILNLRTLDGSLWRADGLDGLGHLHFTFSIGQSWGSNAPFGGGITPIVIPNANLSFGPVIERVLMPGEKFDLDTGRLAPGSGEDADLETGRDQLFALGMFILKWDSGAWEGVPATEMTRLFSHAKQGGGRQSLDVASITYVFRTHEGNLGLLQFEPIHIPPFGVKLRYKLVQNAMTAAADPGTSRGGKPDYAQAVAAMGAAGGFDETLRLAFERGDQATALKTSGPFLEQLRLLNAQLRGTELELPAIIVSLFTQMHEALQAGDMKHGRSLYDAADEAGKAFKETVPDGDFVRRLLKLAAQQREATQPHPETNSLSFGPVIERVVPYGAPCAMQCLQFHTGNILQIGSGPGDTSDHSAEIASKGGIDASVLPLEHGVQLVGQGCIFVTAGSRDWEAMTTEKAVHTLQTESWIQGVLEIAEKDYPSTCLFKTAGGDCGLLQITSFTENPRGVKIRYKLARRMPDTGTQGPQAGSRSQSTQIPSSMIFSSTGGKVVLESKDVTMTADRVEFGTNTLKATNVRITSTNNASVR